MCECRRYDPNDLVIPAVHPLGGFTPSRCCVCGKGFTTVSYRFQEGTVCLICYCKLPRSVRERYAEWTLEQGGGK